MKYTKLALKELIREVAEEHSLDLGPGDAPSFFNESHGFPYPWERRKGKKFGDAEEEEETEEDIEALLEEAHAKLREALDIASRLDPGRALEIGPISYSLDKLLNPEEPEDEDEASPRRSYDKEEAAARREGPSTPLSSEESAALWDDDGEEDW